MERFNKTECDELGTYIIQIRGVSYKPRDLRESVDDGAYILLRANNIGFSGINYDELRYVACEKVSENQLIKDGDILMCGSSGSLEHVGKAALCPEKSWGMTFGAFCKLIRPTGILNPQFIASYFCTDSYRNEIKQLAQGANINNLRNEHIDKLMVPVPTEEEQDDFIGFVRQSDKSKFAALRCSNLNLWSSSGYLIAQQITRHM